MAEKHHRFASRARIASRTMAAPISTNKWEASWGAAVILYRKNKLRPPPRKRPASPATRRQITIVTSYLSLLVTYGNQHRSRGSNIEECANLAGCLKFSVGSQFANPNHAECN